MDYGYTSYIEKYRKTRSKEPASKQDTEAENNDMVFKETKIKNIKEVTEPLKEEILKGTRRSRLFRRSQECSYHR